MPLSRLLPIVVGCFRPYPWGSTLNQLTITHDISPSYRHVLHMPTYLWVNFPSDSHLCLSCFCAILSFCFLFTFYHFADLCVFGGWLEQKEPFREELVFSYPAFLFLSFLTLFIFIVGSVLICESCLFGFLVPLPYWLNLFQQIKKRKKEFSFSNIFPFQVFSFQ